MPTPPQNWFDQLNDQQKPSLEHLRNLILSASSNFCEEIKWGQPCYSINGLTCYLAKAKSHVNLGFQQGAHLPDPSGLLIGDGPNMRHIKFDLNNPVNAELVKPLIEAAIIYDAKPTR